MRLFLTALCFSPASAFAWDRLTEADIAPALAGRALVFDAYTFQTFTAQGRTQYVTERAADGFWTVEGDRYCVSWPPSTLQECYALERDGDRLRFISESGAASIGTYAPE